MGGKVAKDHKKDRIIEDDFVSVDKFDGGVDEFGERKGEGAYFYANGDIYDGDWKKGMKHGYGIYTYANGKGIKGWFYKDRFIGSQPNEKLKKELKKKSKASAGSEPNAPPLQPVPSLVFSPPEDNKTSQPLSRTRISTSQEDISRDDMLGDGDFRRVKSERRMKSYFRRNYKLPGKEEEKFERQRSLRLRQSIRAKYGLPNPSRKNPLLTDS
ncbi:hypothetical protein P5673_010442 [Acropora cervicornis]|uniref:Uncharacterized protein n=1 Tax=Acropora cervicornis TaxID=6130 RepID=A0AAD9QQB9_ACRCE|nr:hypothetical protein P5673_010442 [Acropora cervicornis]